MKDSSGIKFYIERNVYSIYGLRGFRLRWIPLIVFNRILKRLNNHCLCMCGRYVHWSNVYAVCTDDTFTCDRCMAKATGEEHWLRDE